MYKFTVLNSKKTYCISGRRRVKTKTELQTELVAADVCQAALSI